MTVEQIDYKWPDGSLLKYLGNLWEDDDGRPWYDSEIENLLKHGAIAPAPKPLRVVLEGEIDKDGDVRYKDVNGCVSYLDLNPKQTPGTPVTITVEGR